ncbi:cytochrome c peroxidase [Algoriphagus sp. SE2]|uniref:cytochrome-c peroxidase n=1 Tax=Algoriphagus sp. SE2 TaxID=3141536 RepID=UPI0031CD7FAF
MKTVSKLLLLLGITFVSACTQDEDLVIPKQEIHYYLPELSSTLQVTGFPQPERNILSVEGVELGKKLFFDPNISGNGKVSCASCHKTELAFSDGISLTNQGVSGNTLHRHSPVIFNIAWQEDGLFWDGGAHDLESLNFGPLTHPDEMGADLNSIITYLENDPEYKKQFDLVFEEEQIQSATLSRAISQYVRSLISQDSKFDHWKKQEASFTEFELRGYQLFQQNCSNCHKEGLFTDEAYHNNGLDQTYPDPPGLEGLYLGRYRITSNPEDLGAYKTPTLRNIALSAPYMHDGRFATLEEVLDHYQYGIKINESLDPQLKEGIHFNESERKALIAFLGTLTDSSFIQKHHRQIN